MRWVTLAVSCLALLVTLPPPDASAGDGDVVTLSRAITVKIRSSQTALSRLARYRDSVPGVGRLLQAMSPVLDALARQHADLEDRTRRMATRAGDLRARSAELTRLVAAHEQDCAKNDDPSCERARHEIAALRAALEERREAAEALVAAGKDLLRRARLFDVLVKAALAGIRRYRSGDPRRPELAPAAILATSLATVPKGHRDASPVPAAGEPEPGGRTPTEPPVEVPAPEDAQAPAEPAAHPGPPAGCRCVRVRVVRRVGPFCWTACCWRLVPATRASPAPTADGE